MKAMPTEGIKITTEQELLEAFGRPSDPHYKSTYLDLFLEEMKYIPSRNFYVIRVPELKDK